MDRDAEQKQKAALRKKRRRKESIKALAIVGGVVIVGLAIVIGIIAGLVHLFTADSKKKAETAVVAEKAVDDEPDSTGGEEAADEADADKEDAGSGADLSSVSDNEAPSQEQSEDEDSGQTAGGSIKDEKEISSSENDRLLAAGGKEKTVAGAAGEDAEIEKRIDDEIENMSIEEKISKLFILSPGQLAGNGIESPAIGGKAGDQLAKYPITGILFKPGNLSTEENLLSSLDHLSSYGGGNQLNVISEQGGEKSPFVLSGITENVIASEKEIGESLGTAGAYSAGISIGSELKHYGMQVNIAPYADVPKTSGSFAAANGFNQDLETTTELAANMVRGMKDQNIIAAVGCFPGYGDVTNDGSNGIPVSQRTKEQLIEESAPYQAAIRAGADIVIISHVGLPKLRGDQRPASLSKEVITDIVREEWEYDGVVMTDYMDKTCIYQKYTYAEAAVGAIEAGADILLSTKNFQKSFEGIRDAVKKGTLTEERIDESVRRILRMKYRQEAAKESGDNLSG